MKYLLLLNVSSGGPYQHLDWPERDFKAHMAFMRDFNRKLLESGELVAVQALASPDQAVCVRASAHGPPVTDGVFPEAKEFLAGYWIVDVDHRERAIELAAEASAAPGRGGVPLNMPIEVRLMMTDLP